MRRRYPNRHRRELLTWGVILSVVIMAVAYFAVYLPFLSRR